MNWVLSLFVLLGVQDVESLINQTPTCKDYPKAGAVVLLDRKVLEIHNDLSSSSSRELLIKVFNDRGKGKYGDIKTRYNKKVQDFQIITTQTHTPDGKKVQVEEKAITDLSAPEVMQASAYTNVRMKVVSFPALEPDAVIEYQYKIVPKNKSKSFLSNILGIFKKKEPKYFFGEIVFGEDEPILKREFKLIVPQGVEFKYALVGATHESPPQIEHSDDKIIYTWVFENIDAIIKEPQGPPISELAPRLIFSSFASWDELAKWLGDKFYRSIEVNKKIKKLTASFSDAPEEKIRDCFLYVTTEIRNIELPVGSAGYTPIPACQVHSNKYGDSRDKASLLCSFLKAGGIEAFPVFVNKNQVSIIKEIPSPSQFNHIILAVSGKNGYFIVDPQATNSKFGYLPEEEQGIDGFVVFKEGWTFNPTLTIPREVNLSKSMLKLYVSSEGNLKGEINTELDGFYDRRARRQLKDKTKKEEQIWVESAMSGIATNTKLLNYSFSNLKDLVEPVILDASFEAYEFGSVSDNTIQLFIPKNPFDFAEPSQLIGLSNRKYLLLLHSAGVIRYEVEIKIPEGWTADYLPENLTRENDFASVKVTADTLNHKLCYTSELILKKTKIVAEEYAEFKSLVGEFLKRKTRMVILKKI